MSSGQVLPLLDALDEAGVAWWVDGGWGIDALIGRQTRTHDDLDLVVPVRHLATCRRMLEDNGFALERELLPAALAWRHPDGRSVDLHLVEPTPDGGGDQVQVDGATRLHDPPPVAGPIEARPVRCCSLASQIDTHVGYAPDAGDRADMAMLAEAFGVTLPPPFGPPGGATAMGNQ